MIQILKIVMLILELIMEGVSEDDAITSMCNKYGVAKELIRKFL